MEFDEANLRPTYRLLVGVPGTSSGIEIARRLGLPERVVEHAQASLSPESREARELIAYLHRSRDEMEEIKRQAREELAQLEAERRELQTEWVERQRKRIAELEKNFAEAQKRLEARSGAPGGGHERPRDCARRWRSNRLGAWANSASDARAETDAAVVETLASSQQDLGIMTASTGKAG